MSFPRYPAYKNSGVEWLGDVPEHWSIYSLKRSVEGCVNGIWGDEPDGEFDVPVIRVADFDRAKSRVSMEKLTYRSIPLKDRLSRELKSGDLLIEKSGGGEKMLVGCTVLFEHDFEAVTSNFVARMRPHRGYESGFLCYVLDTLYQGRLNYPAIKQTTGIQNLDSEAYLQGRFCFPSYGEQAQIASFLDHETAKINALIEEQQRLIELLKEKRQAVISQAVTKGLDPHVPMKDTGVKWLGKVPVHWETGALRWYATIQGGLAKGKDYVGQETVTVPYLRVANVQNGFVDLTEVKEISVLPTDVGRFSLRAGDVLMNEGGDNDKLGRGAVWQAQIEPCLHQNHVFAIRPNYALSAEWLALFTQSDQARTYFFIYAKQSTNLASISASNVMSMIIPLPCVEEQNEIMSYLAQGNEKYDQLIGSALATVKLLEERRSALISAAVTGKIDVRGWHLPKPPRHDSHPEHKSCLESI
ncbi:restriction endonuclease subunit S [Alcaligenaceae bacterium]|nr:restriction endonuclease subunit S [Alcaligenaceae bacterium]